MREVDQEEVIVPSPLTVIDNGRKLRQILDLRYVNVHLAKSSFNFDDDNGTTRSSLTYKYLSPHCTAPEVSRL